jgi:hypothetical protein
MTALRWPFRRARIEVRFSTDLGLRERAAMAAAERRLQAGRCLLCGGEVESVLIRLGSTLCHDCRDGQPGLTASVSVS